MSDTKSQKLIFAHIAVWFSYVVLLVLFNSEIRDYDAAILRSLSLAMVQAILFYINLELLLPYFLERKRYVIYALSLILLIVVSMYLMDEIMRFFNAEDFHREMAERDGKEFRRNWEPDKDHIRPVPDYVKERFMRGRWFFHAFTSLIALFFSMVYYNTRVSRKRERESIHLKNQMLEAESKMLKWQMNPHFLFNTLNNIYSLSQMQSVKTPDAIHRLSEMLRYVIYDCKGDRVKLGQEINYLGSYIELQRLKDEKLENIDYDFNSVNENLQIAPLLLIAFVENSFKHSRIAEEETGFIRMRLKTEGSKMEFSIENSIGKPLNDNNQENGGGLGLENVKRRLELLYPGNSMLDIEHEEKVFRVNLQIDLDEN